MFRRLFIFREHSTQEPFCGPAQEPLLATANAEKKISGEVLGKMQVNGPEG